MLAKSLHAEVLQIKTDPEGRYVVLIIQIISVIHLGDCLCTPPFYADVLVKLSLMLLSGPPGLLYVGDFNAVMSPAMDRLE